MSADQISGGRAALRGFAYQESVTVWVALELMFARKDGIEHIELEPDSQEDLAVALPGLAESTSTPPGKQRLLSIQVKHRDDGAWGRSALVDLLGIPQRPPGSRGPARRASPVERLAANPEENYLLITDATLDSALHSIMVSGILDQASAPRLPAGLKRRLPPGVHIEDLAPRITVLKPKEQDHFHSLTEALLKRHLHVPGLFARECREALTRDVQSRMNGGGSRFWTKQDIVATVRRFQGLPVPTEELDDFVPPRNFEEMKTQLERRHLLFLLGPPGVGKTLVARKLAYEYQTASEPFAFVATRDLTSLRDKLESTREPTVFFIEDPFGPTRPEAQADLWLKALPGLLDEARPDKKLIIMSRLAVLRASTERPQFRQLQGEAMLLDSTDYDASARWRILQNKLKRAVGWQRALVDDHRAEVLEHLQAPLSIKLFAKQVMKLETVDRFRLRALLRESAVDQIANIVEHEVRGLPWNAVPSALVLWSLLKQGAVFPREAALARAEVLRGVDRDLHVDMRRLLDWMRAAGWLTEDPEGYRAHPTVTAGLELLLGEESDLLTEVISALLNGLLAQESYRDVLDLGRALPDDSQLLSRKAHVAFDDWLRSELLLAEGASLPEVHAVAARWIRGGDPVAVLVRALFPRSERKNGFRQLTTWRLPAWPKPLLDALRASPEARTIMERFIQYVLPGVSNVFHGQFVWDLDFLGWHFPQAFAAAAPVVIREPTNALSAILLGAVSCGSPPFDELIELLCSELKRLWDKVYAIPERRDADQGHLDALEAAAIDDQYLDERAMLAEELHRIIERRRAREGYAWLPGHPRRRDLIFYWCRAIKPEDASLDEFRALVAACEPGQRWMAYEVMGRTRLKASAPLLLDVLATAEGHDARACLHALLELWPVDEVEAGLSPLLAFPEARRAALVAIVGNDLPWDERDTSKPGAQEILARILFPSGAVALRACIRAQARSPWPPELDALSSEDRERLWQWVSSSSPELHGAAVRVLAAVGEPVAAAAESMLESPLAPFRAKVIQALSSDLSPEATTLLARALHDPDSKCRTAAILALAPRAEGALRQAVLETAKDPSGFVREACVAAIRNNRWSEGLETLFALLSDEQDFSLGFTDESREHEVAFNTAQALVELAPLPESLVRKLLDFLRGEERSNRDATVHQQLMVLFMVQPQEETFPLLVHLLQSPMRRVVRLQVHYPVRKGAVWALLEQLTQHPELAQRLELPSLVEAALHADPALSGGACLVLGRMGPVAWPGAEAALREEGRWERAFLLGAEWIRAHRGMPPEGVQALLPTQAAHCLKWLLAHAPDTTAPWLSHPEVWDWLTTLTGGGAWWLFLRYYLQLYFHAPALPNMPVGSVPGFLKTLAYAFFVAPQGRWREVAPDGASPDRSHRAGT